jgi:hypothetical protein
MSYAMPAEVRHEAAGIELAPGVQAADNVPKK